MENYKQFLLTLLVADRSFIETIFLRENYKLDGNIVYIVTVNCFTPGATRKSIEVSTVTMAKTSRLSFRKLFN
jgi:hypothetical protein